MDVVDAISRVQTTTRGVMANVPVETVVITKATIKEQAVHERLL